MIQQSMITLMSIVTVPKWMWAILFAFVAIFAPVAAIIHVLLVLVIIDTLTGIGASMKRNDLKFCMFCVQTWHHIESAKLGVSLSKMLAYLLLVISAFLVDAYILGMNEDWFTKVIAASVAFREILSILENVEVISGRTILIHRYI